MSGSHSAHSGEAPIPKRLNVFERYLSLWVALCMGAGIFAGKMFPAAVDALRKASSIAAYRDSSVTLSRFWAFSDIAPTGRVNAASPKYPS